jgi:ABC-type microcin C transport system duplicated ATPase subunit YejF
MRVGEIVGEPLEVHHSELNRAEKQERTAAMLQRVGLAADALRRYPHEFFRRAASKDRDCAGAHSAAKARGGR